ncbi:hypothetical protein GGS23DRAFT_460825 [Durotheca rogersii]|uniref:uncharacterized protein n=1 Tax=Durotheca rogersii TaxID=419775 RepID=UPI00221E82F7|nr:uncharacterized protein GGS23DRAFT_460825 [Durotheca rogersii]KAI5864729.1 hypothetical protein GGS23DRAFT_460825 [Durotheca rogersii]
MTAALVAARRRGIRGDGMGRDRREVDVRYVRVPYRKRERGLTGNVRQGRERRGGLRQGRSCSERGEWTGGRGMSKRAAVRRERKVGWMDGLEVEILFLTLFFFFFSFNTFSALLSPPTRAFSCLCSSCLPSFAYPTKFPSWRGPFFFFFFPFYGFQLVLRK